MSRKVRVLAPAKVNLTLEVLGRRGDGYHELASVMATLDLHDDVRIGPARALDVRIRPPLELPRGDDLASRAVLAMAAACGRAADVHVTIRKRIPVAAGLGGGSSDAGAVLRGVAELWQVRHVDLVHVAAGIGSDVPFFATASPIARIRGRGERVEPLSLPTARLWIALVTLPVRAATRDVFAALERASGDGSATDALARALQEGSATPEALRALARNDLTAAAERVCPLVADARAAARDRGIGLQVSGSGPSLFAIADDRADAIRIARSLRRAGLRARPHQVAVAPSLGTF